MARYPCTEKTRPREGFALCIHFCRDPFSVPVPVATGAHDTAVPMYTLGRRPFQISPIQIVVSLYLLLLDCSKAES